MPTPTTEDLGPLLQAERQARLAAEEAHRRLSVLSDASIALASSLDFEATLLGAARLMVSHLAEWCVLALHTHGGRPPRVVVAHRDPQRADLARELARRLSEGAAWAPAARVLAGGQAERVSDPLALSADRELLEALGAGPGLVVPLDARGKTVGTVTLVWAKGSPEPGPGDVAFAQDLALRAGTALQHARAHEARAAALHEKDQALLAAEEARAALGLQERRFRALIEHATDGIALTSAAGELRYLSPSTARVLGHAPADLLGRRALELLHPDDRPSAERALLALARRPGETIRLHHRTQHGDGRWRPVESTVTNLLEEPAVRALVTNYRDVSERHHDGLTGLPDRLLLRELLGQALASAHRSGRGVGLVSIDVDGLASVNDAHGQLAGDELLRVMASRLRGCLRESDVVARVGGDEFVALLPDLALAEDAARAAHKLLAALCRPVPVGPHSVQATASIGVALYPADGVEIDTLLGNAEAARERVHELGGNGYQLCTPEQNQLAFERLRLERGLRHAIERQELCLFYQPEVDVLTGELAGAEALLRWQHPELGLLPASSFVPLAERTRLMVPIGEWAFGQVCRQVRAWQISGQGPPRVAMNVSGVQFQQRHLARFVERTLEETGMDPAGLEIEVTETVAMRDADAAKRLMGELRALGLSLAIDDFGTGYSSLAALKRFPIQTLKIDQSFIADVARESDDAVLVRAIIHMAHTLRLKVVAEGVETAEQMAFLNRERCDVVQGYYLGRPAPPDALLHLN